jgi:hypothetical protein
MARYYLSTAQFSVWKEHACVGCGGAYRYLLRRKKSARGATAEAASANLRAAAVRALTREVDMHPCPACGRYQPDMIAVRRGRAHWFVFAAAAGLLAAVLIVGLVAGVGARRWAPPAAAGVAGLALAAHALVNRWDPNRDREANRRLAAQRAEAGVLRETAPPDPAAPPPARGGWSVVNTLAYLLLALAATAFALPEGLRAAGGYPVNSGCWPPVAGPGDTVRVEFPDHITSVKGLWQGQAHVYTLNAREVGLPEDYAIPATSASGSWGGTIRVQSDETKSRSALWADLHLPPAPDLAGKKLRLRVDLEARYPAPAPQGDHFTDEKEMFSRTLTLQAAPSPEIGAAYNAWWVGGVLAGFVLTLAAGVLLALRAGWQRRKAPPTRLVAPDPAGGAR